MNLSKAQFLRSILLFSLGALSSFSFAPHTQIWTIFIAIPVLFRLLSKTPSLKIGFLYGWAFGFGQFSFGLYWISNAFKLDSVDLSILAPFVTVLFPMGLACFLGFSGLTYVWLYRRLIGTLSLKAAFLFSFLFYLGEFLRGIFFTGFPWNLQGYAFWPYDAILQTTSLIGIYGLSFLTVFWASLLGLIWKAGFRLQFRAFCCVTLTFSSLLLYGFYRLDKHPIEQLAYHDHLKLRLVQANIDQNAKWEKAKAHQNLNTYLELSKSNNFDQVTDVIWPETALPFVLSLNRELGNALKKIVPKGGRLLSGGTRYVDTPSQKIWNSLYAVDDAGDIIDFYDKKHLVPFGEFMPLNWLFNLSKLSYGDLDFSEGIRPNLMKIGNLHPFSALICYEVIFPEEVRRSAKGAEFLVNITNDAWYGNSAGPQQHLQIARMRAIENGVALMRSANTGVSAVIDPLGRILQKLDYGTSGIIDTALPKALPTKTLYSSLGDWFFVIFLFFATIISVCCGNRQKF